MHTCKDHIPIDCMGTREFLVHLTTVHHKCRTAFGQALGVYSILFHAYHRDSKKTSCKSFSAKFHGEFQDAPHFVNVEYGGCEDISINEHNPDTYLCKSKGIGVRTSQRTEVNGKPTRKMKRKVMIKPRKLASLSAHCVYCYVVKICAVLQFNAVGPYNSQCVCYIVHEHVLNLINTCNIEFILV